MAFAFGLTWIYFFAFILTGFKWDLNSSKASVVGLGMLFPFVANILTKFVTKEGFAMNGKDSLMLGIAYMCVMCTCLGIILTFVTERSESIWPATFMHAVNNGGPTILYFFINEEIFNEKFANPLISWGLLLIPTAIIAIICFVITCKRINYNSKIVDSNIMC